MVWYWRHSQGTAFVSFAVIRKIFISLVPTVDNTTYICSCFMQWLAIYAMKIKLMNGKEMGVCYLVWEEWEREIKNRKIFISTWGQVLETWKPAFLVLLFLPFALHVFISFCVWHHVIYACQMLWPANQLQIFNRILLGSDQIWYQCSPSWVWMNLPMHADDCYVPYLGVLALLHNKICLVWHSFWHLILDVPIMLLNYSSLYRCL